MRYITIGGQSRPLLFTYRALRRLADNLECKNFQELGEKTAAMGFDDIPFLAFLGLKEGAKAEGIAFDVTPEQVAVWMDDEPAGIFTAVMQSFEEDFTAGGTTEKNAPAARKK